MKILLIGFGNPGRLDDGLGPAFAERLAALAFPDVTVESNYQLNVEDAELISRYDMVVFADASVSAEPPFEFSRMEPSEPMVGFSSHSISPPSVLGLTQQLFHARPAAWMMEIRGYSFDDFGEKFSTDAEVNLSAAVEFLKNWLPQQQIA